MNGGAVAAGILLLAAGSARASDLYGWFAMRARLDPQTREELASSDAERLLLAKRAREGTGNRGLEGVVRTQLKWKTPEISVCFFDGETERQAEIAAIANTWTAGTGVRFDFGDPLRPRQCSAERADDIRVSLQNRDGNSSSEVGTNAALLPNDLPTLILGGFGEGLLDEEKEGTVLHEFGHALGFDHEYQSPSGNCDHELNWPYLYAHRGPKRFIDEQLRSFLGTGHMTGIYASAFDPLSIMISPLPREAFLAPEKARCYGGVRANRLSETDIQTVRAIYPPAGD